MLNKTPNLEKDGQTKLCPLKSSNSFLFVHTLHMTSPWPTAQGTLVPCRCTCKTLLSGWSIANNPLFLSDFKWSSSGCKRRCLGQAIPIRSLLQHVYWFEYIFSAQKSHSVLFGALPSRNGQGTRRVFSFLPSENVVPAGQGSQVLTLVCSVCQRFQNLESIPWHDTVHSLFDFTS